MAKVINIGTTATEVRLTHAKKDMLYFAENVLEMEFPPLVKLLMDELKRKYSTEDE